MAAALQVGEGLRIHRVGMRAQVAPDSQAVTVFHPGQWLLGLARMKLAEGGCWEKERVEARTAAGAGHL